MSCDGNGTGKPCMAVVKRIVQETPTIKTFYADYAMDARPGQFAMIWLPGCDEKPFTLTAAGKECAVTVREKGKFTKAVFELKKGDRIGIRGPYGNGFEFEKVKRACIVAGGCGAAPIVLLAEQLKKKGASVSIVLGAGTGKECLFRKRLEKAAGKVYITTDDGSLGEKAFASDALEKLLEKGKFGVVFGCGPEGMMKKVFAACEKAKVECQLNLERFMGCGFGICGSCAIGEFLVCKDGPVFTGEQLRKTRQFGESAMLKSGKAVSIKEFADWRQQ